MKDSNLDKMILHLIWNALLSVFFLLLPLLTDLDCVGGERPHAEVVLEVEEEVVVLEPGHPGVLGLDGGGEGRERGEPGVGHLRRAEEVRGAVLGQVAPVDDPERARSTGALGGPVDGQAGLLRQRLLAGLALQQGQVLQVQQVYVALVAVCLKEAGIESLL